MPPKKSSPVATGERISLEAYRALLAAGTSAGGRAPRVKRQSPEEDLQRTCFEWISLRMARYPILRFALHVPNGGKRPKGEAGKMKAMGVKKGFPDIITPLAFGKWRGFAAELKSSTGRVSAEQEEWLGALAESGWLTGVCRSLGEFELLVGKYLKSRL